MRLANRNHQKAKVNKQIFFLLFEQNQITSHEKVKEREGTRFIRSPIKWGGRKLRINKTKKKPNIKQHRKICRSRYVNLRNMTLYKCNVNKILY